MERATPRPTLRERLRNFSLRSLFSRRRQASETSPRPMEISVNQRISVYGNNDPGAVTTNVTPRVAGPQPVPVAQRRPTAHDQRMGRTAIVNDPPPTREGTAPRVQIVTPPSQTQTPGRTRR